MTVNNLARINAWAALFCITLAMAGQTSQSLPEQRFRLIRGKIIVVPTEINGQGPFAMVLDTGTNTTLVDTKLAQKLALPAIDRTRLNTVAGSQIAVRGSISSVAIGPASAENIEAVVLDLGELRKLDSEIVGIIGQNVLAHFNYLIDYNRRSLRFENGSELLEGLAGERIPFTTAEQILLISVEIGAPDRGVSMVLDSAASSAILFRPSKAAIQATGRETYQVITNNGSGVLNRGVIHELKIGSERFRELPVALAPGSPVDDQRAEDGLLPTSLFRSIYINNRDGFVILNCRNRVSGFRTYRPPNQSLSGSDKNNAEVRRYPLLPGY